MRIILLFILLCIPLLGCSDDPDPNPEGTEITYVVEGNVMSGITAKQYVGMSSEAELTSLWDYNNQALQNGGITQLPLQPMIDFNVRDAVAIFPRDSTTCARTTVNRVMELGEKVIVRLRRERIPAVPILCFPEDTVLILISFDKQIGLENRLYEVVYDCIRCDPEAV